jgi:putative intracellular protease/amidase
MTNILIVLTSHAQMGNTGKKTGYYFDEMAAPYLMFADAGHNVDIASIEGGAPAYDPNSVNADLEKRPASVQRFMKDPSLMAKLLNTLALKTVDIKNYDAIFLAGGHGVMWDFAVSDTLADAVSNVYNQGGVVGAVCHGPVGLINAKRADGRPLVEGLRVNGFTDAEERAVKLEGVVPLLLETRLRSLGGKFENGPNFSDYVVRDGRLVTGQNPQSAHSAAKLVVEALAEQHKQAA